MHLSRVWTCGLFIVAWLCCSSLLIGAKKPSTSPEEVKALQAIKSSLIDPNGNLSDWDQGDPCTSRWTGVFCNNTALDDGHLHVDRLLLLRMNLSGTLSPEIGRLSNLKILDFMWNNISGSIPKEIGNIMTLELLLLNGNQLTGPLPEELGYFPNLDRIQIDENHISGPIPKSFANLNKTRHFHMNNNSISGQIPPELSRLPNLIHFLLDNNNLSGYLPPEFSELPNLQILQFDNNNFDGTTIPASYSKMSKLLKLSLRNCSLQGPIPDFSQIPNLYYLDLSSNQLNETIPSDMFSRNITTILLSHNHISGTIPTNFSDLPHLQRLSIANNSLSGSVPSSIWQNRAFNGMEKFTVELQNNNLANISGTTYRPPNVSVWLQENPLCLNSNLAQFCGPEIEDDKNSQSSTNTTSVCPAQACPSSYEHSPTSPVVCFCALPLFVGYRLKSPAFSDFRPYRDEFEKFLTSRLELSLYQLYIDSFTWEEGPRLGMQLKFFPVSDSENNAQTFSKSEVQRIFDVFTSWTIHNNDLFGPAELISFPILGFYKYDSDTGSKRLKVTAIATSFAGIGVLIMIYCFWRKLSSIKNIKFWKKENLAHQNVEAFLRNHGPPVIRRYSYSDVKTMTKSFNDKLGQGGYGSVYKGKLQDGCFVAVKVLNNSKGNGEEFINEVASISRTSHVNIVTLKGFCFEGSKRVLIYELMPNGSLEKFIYKGNPSSSNYQLGWETLYKIAIGIARGLEYLHRGCNTRILHFDIKPHNILLDENFCPKISDFGLAKICPREKSTISMVGARGTTGYIAPEVFCRSFGGISHKSDVYSYGMMVLEMVGGRKNIDVSVDLTSEIYFPHWIYKRLELNEELGLLGLLKEGDEDTAKKMIIVSLWCIQIDPSNRPSMSKVVDMLEGSLESLQIPPKPCLSSPPRSPIDSSTVMMSIQYDSMH